MIRRYGRLLGLFAAVETQYELEYRVNLAFNVLQQLVVTGTSLGAVLILFSYTTTMNGWSVAEMLILIGTYYIVQGVGDSTVGPSVERLLEHIRLGTLDFTLLKPANSQFLVTMRHFKVRNLFGVLTGLIIIGIGLGQLNSAPVAAAGAELHPRPRLRASGSCTACCSASRPSRSGSSGSRTCS